MKYVEQLLRAASAYEPPTSRSIFDGALVPSAHADLDSGNLLILSLSGA